MGKVDQKNKRGDIYKITDAVIHLYLVYMFVIFLWFCMMDIKILP